MSPEPRALVALCTCPNRETAETLARAAVEAGLAACVNVLPGVVSMYRWEGEVQRDEELLLVAKTTPDAVAALERCWSGLHPYELPEFVGVPVVSGSDGYLAWIEQSVSSPARS